MAKIIILGANGNLGGELVKAFSTENNDVIAWDKEEIDITDKELIIKKVSEIKPNIIINATAYNAVDKCEEDDAEFELAKVINGKAPGYMAEAALESGAIFVHYSTDYVFGGRRSDKTVKEIKKQGGYREDDEPSPVNRYGESKLMGESEIKKFSGKGLKWYLIRTQKLFGPKGKSEFAKPSFFDIMLKAAADGKELNVVDDEKSGFTYTPDLAKATRQLLEGDYGYGIYHFSNIGEATWYKAAKELFALSRQQVKLNPVNSDFFPRPAKRPHYSTLLNTKFEQLRDWREALAEYLKNKQE